MQKHFVIGGIALLGSQFIAPKIAAALKRQGYTVNGYTYYPVESAVVTSALFLLGKAMWK